MRAWSKVSIDITNEHDTKSGERTRVFALRPGVFYTDIPDWVTAHPIYQAATLDYTDPHGIVREADIVLFDDANEHSFPTFPPSSFVPVSGTNVSENPSAGKALKGASLRSKDKAAPTTATAQVVEELTPGASGE